MSKRNDIGGARRLAVPDNEPAPTIMAGGIGSVNTSQYAVQPKLSRKDKKPPYRVPLMAEIAAVPWNGYNAISLFSGCGGSSLGYKMAGFRVLWASEFIPAAAEVYRLNHPDTILDTRDIREVHAEDILSAIQIKAGELDLLDGSPPCASFSMAGKREAGWGKAKPYSDTVQRTDDLFYEYARILEGIQPKVFIAENVSGLVKGVAKGYFLDILKRLKACGYRVVCRCLDAQWLGVPQARQRVIFIGVRNDLDAPIAYPAPLPYRYSVRDAIPWIDSIEGANGFNQHAMKSADTPAATVQQSRPLMVTATNERHTLAGRRPAREVSEPAPTVTATVPQFNIIEVASDISRFAIGADAKHIPEGGKSNRYINLLRAHRDRPSPTVMQTAGITGAAGVIHPTEMRKFSIAELKRICAFPDDFQLTGTYSQQWERLGRAVPPVMMAHIAATIRDETLCKIR